MKRSSSRKSKKKSQKALPAGPSKEEYCEAQRIVTMFPTPKIKAQILKDDDIGRINTKAVELIGMYCSQN